MKKFVVCAMLAVTTASSLASSIADFLIPNPTSMIISIGSWIVKNRKEVYQVRVSAVGGNEEQARQQALRLAINQALGSLLVSETDIVNGNLNRHEILNYSAGYIDDFEILERKLINHGVEITLDVWVSKSQLVDRVISKSKDRGRINGAKTAEQIESLARQRKNSDRLLNNVLRDYPKRAYNINLGTAQVILNPQRIPVLEVPLQVFWNSNYIGSLKETLRNINQRSDCGGWLKDCVVQSVITVGDTVGYFDDSSAFNAMHKEMLISKPQVKLTIFDHNSRPVLTQCYSMPELDQIQWSKTRFVDVGGNNVTIDPRLSKNSSIYINLNSINIKELERVDVEVVRLAQCRV